MNTGSQLLIWNVTFSLLFCFISDVMLFVVVDIFT